MLDIKKSLKIKDLFSKEVEEKVDLLLKEVVFQIQSGKEKIEVFVPYGYTTITCYEKVIDLFVKELKKQLDLEEADIQISKETQIYKEIRVEVSEEPREYERWSDFVAEVYDSYSDMFEKRSMLGTEISFSYKA